MGTPACLDSKAPECPQRKDRVFQAFDILESGGQEEDNECESLPDATEDAGQEEDAGSGLSPHATEGAGQEEDNECESVPDASEDAGQEEDAGSGLSPRATEGAGREEDNECESLPDATEGAGREEDAGSGLSPHASEGVGREEDNESGMLPRATEAPDDNAVNSEISLHEFDEFPNLTTQASQVLEGADESYDNSEFHEYSDASELEVSQATPSPSPDGNKKRRRGKARDPSLLEDSSAMDSKMKALFCDSKAQGSEANPDTEDLGTAGSGSFFLLSGREVPKTMSAQTSTQQAKVHDDSAMPEGEALYDSEFEEESYAT